jgi:hypothetical protein
MAASYLIHDYARKRPQSNRGYAERLRLVANRGYAEGLRLLRLLRSRATLDRLKLGRRP